MKKIFKSLLAVVLCITFSLGNVPVATHAQETGTISYRYDKTTKTLTISGKGAMADYTFYAAQDGTNAPWDAYKFKTKKIVVENGVTCIGASAFSHFPYVTEAELADSVEIIRGNAFCQCDSLVRIKVGTGLKIVEEYACQNAHALAEIYISDLEAWCNAEDLRGLPGNLYLNGKLITEFVVPDSVTEICHGLCAHRDAITSVVLHDKVTSIGKQAFYGTSITSIQIPNSVTSIGDGAFESSDLVSIEIPDSVTSIGDMAFGSSDLVSIEIPDSVTEIGRWFWSCKALKDVTLPSTLESIGPGAFGFCSSFKEITIPDGVKSIGARAFCYCTELTNIVIPDSVSTVGDSAFERCQKLKNVTLSKNLEEIRAGMFNECSSLESIVIPDSVISIGDLAFGFCTNLKNVQLSQNVVSIGSAFCGCKGLTKMDLPTSVIEIGNKAFFRCTGLSEMILSTSVELVGDDAFSGCTGLSKIELPDSVVEIGDYAFSECTGLSKIELPASVVEVGNYAFSGCGNITSVAFSEGINRIGEYAFRNCSGISSVTIPASVAEIGDYAFENCSSLKEITFLGNAPSIGAYTFRMVSATCWYTPDDTWTKEILANDFGGDLKWTYEGEVKDEEFYYCGKNITWTLSEDGTLTLLGTGPMYDYSAEEINYAPWYENRASVKKIVVGEGITYIGNEAFYGCRSSSLTIDLPGSLNSIGNLAFYQFGAKSVTIPDGVKYMGTEAFKNSRLESITLSDKLEDIPNNIFEDSYYLKKVVFPSELKTIGDSAFKNCFGLESVVLPEGLTCIGEYAFACCGAYDLYHWDFECSSFKSVILPSTLKTIGKGAFKFCQSLESITIPDSVMRIQESTFTSCYRLTSVTVSANINSIEDAAFWQCKRLNKITFRWGAPQINSKTFSSDMTTTCYYPQNNPAWTADMLQNYGGKLTWIAQEMKEPAEGSGGGSGENAGKEEGENSGESGGISGDTDSGETEGGNTEGGESSGGSSGSEGGTEGSEGTGEGSGSGSGTESGSGSGETGGTGTGGEGTGTGTGGSGTESEATERLKFKGASLTLYDNLTINYKVEKSLLEGNGYTNPYIVFLFNGVESTVMNYTEVDDCYVFDFSNIAPHQMNDTIYATLHANLNGMDCASETKEFSVAAYCYRTLDKYATDEYAKLRTLLVDLLNYGAKSQEYMNYHTDNLVNASLTETQAMWGTSEAPELQTVQNTAYKEIENPTVIWKGAGLNLKDSITMRFKFVSSESIENLKVKVVSESGQWVIDADSFIKNEDGYYVFFDGLDAGKMCEAVYLTVYDGETAVSNTICYSIESYAYAKQNSEDEKLASLLDAMMKYGNSAYSYIH